MQLPACTRTSKHCVMLFQVAFNPLFAPLHVFTNPSEQWTGHKISGYVPQQRIPINTLMFIQTNIPLNGSRWKENLHTIQTRDIVRHKLSPFHRHLLGITSNRHHVFTQRHTQLLCLLFSMMTSFSSRLNPIIEIEWWESRGIHSRILSNFKVDEMVIPIFLIINLKNSNHIFHFSNRAFTLAVCFYAPCSSPEQQQRGSSVKYYK